MAEAAKRALQKDSIQVVADAGYPNGEHAAFCEANGMMPFVPVMRTVNNQGDGTLFGRSHFLYDQSTDNYLSTGDKQLLRKHTNHKIATPCTRRRAVIAEHARSNRVARKLLDEALLAISTKMH